MTKTSKIILWVAIVIVVIWGITAGNKDTKISISDEPFKIGVIAPLSGPFAAYGEDLKKGVEAGAASTTGVNFIFEDDKCDPMSAVTAFHKLIYAADIHFIIGPGCGSPQEAIVPLLGKSKIIAVVPSAASRDLYARSGGNFFNIQYSLEDESKYIAETIYAKGYKKVALVTYANAFSNTHADSFKANYKGEIAVDTVLMDNNGNILTELAKIKAVKADAIYSPDITFFFAGATTKLQQLKMAMPVFTTYVAELPAVISLVEGVFYSFPADIDSTGGAVYNLSKLAAEALVPTVIECTGDPVCVKDKLFSSGRFDDAGVYKRGMVLKQITNGQATLIK